MAAAEHENPIPEIRLATFADAAVISSLLDDAFAEYRSQYTYAGYTATTPKSDLIRQRMLEGPIWIATLEETIVGTVSAVSRGTELYIRGMAVAPGARGLGLGELLLNQIEIFAHENGHEVLILSTTPFLHRAIRLYEQYGFQRTEDPPHDLSGTPLFTMAKDTGRLARPETHSKTVDHVPVAQPGQ